MSEFRDNGETLYNFEDYRVVEYPGCAKPIDLRGLRIACPHCGHNKEYVSSARFDLNLYLEINCGGNKLWALNPEHLDFIENYVSATLRVRQPNVNRSVASRLPKWILNKNNRDTVLSAIKKLKQKLEKDGYKQRT